MPIVNISITKGESPDVLENLLNIAMDAIQLALQLPSDDRNIRVTEYESYLFSMKKPYRLIVEITMFAGRSNDTKRKLYHQLVSDISEKLKYGRSEILILINEQPMENWGVRGGIPANEVDLGFKVNI